MASHITLATLALLLASQATAAAGPCTAASLKGQYIFAGQGLIEALEPGVQRVHYGYFAFDGTGKMTGRQSSSRGGKIGREKLEGIYTVEPDCSGSIAFHFAGRPNTMTHWDLYITSDGRKGHIIRMDEGNMAVRSFEK